MPELSLVVCTLGRTEQLARLLTSLKAQTLRDFEVILVDQNEPGLLDGLVAAFSDGLRIVHLRSPRGLSLGRNVGLARCGSPLIGFPDDDCWYGARVLENVHERFSRRGGLDVLMGRTVDATGRESLTRHRTASGPIDRSNVFESGTSNTLFVRRDAAAETGGFDESLGVGAPTPFQSGEETDFVLRCIGRGYEGYHDRDFCVFHDQIGHGGVNAARARVYAVGFGRLLRIHRYGAGALAVQSLRGIAGGLLCLLRADLEGVRRRRDRIAGMAEGFFAQLAQADGGEPTAGRSDPRNARCHLRRDRIPTAPR